jgi:coproporphyrinogen III oxidase
MLSRSASGTIELLDPWNEPICFVMSRGDDEEIVCRGLRQHIIFGGGEDERPWNNPRGLGVSRSKPTEVILDGRFRETIVVYMSVRFSKQDIEDRKRMKKHQEEREAKATGTSSIGPG